MQLKTLNKRLAALGFKETLQKGVGYFYFADGDTENWMETSVYVASLNQLSLMQWVSELERLKSDQVVVQAPEIVDMKVFILQTMIDGVNEATKRAKIMVPSSDFYTHGQSVEDTLYYIDPHDLAMFIQNKITELEAF